MKFLDPVSLAKLRNISLQLRRLTAEGREAGRHRSLWKGFSRDFAEHRPYAPGDPIKELDWKVYARLDRYFVREYSSESVLSTQLIVDASGSMGFASGGRESKYAHGCRVAMGLAYLILSKGDAVGLTVFDTEPRRAVAPRSGLAHLEQLDAALAETRPGGETDLASALERAAARLKRRSLVVLVSDLLGDPAATARVARVFRARRHELMVLQVLDPQERDLDYEGPVAFESLEDKERLECEPGALRRLYRAEFERFLRLSQAGFQGSGARYEAVFTDAPWDRSLHRLLARTG